MVTKTKTGKKKGKVKVGKLKVNKETVKDLTGNQQKEIRGGARTYPKTLLCPSKFPACI